MFGEGEDIVIVVDDREFGGAVEGLFETVEDGDFVFDVVEEIADVLHVDIEEEGATVGAADLGESDAEAFEGLEHEGDLPVGDHGPVGFAFDFTGDGHSQAETEDLVKGERCADVADKEVRGEGVHILFFCSNILKKLVIQTKLSNRLF